MTTLIQDVRYALRQLLKTPGFTVTAVLTLALGIGANAAIFTLVNAVLQKKLPVVDPKTLVRLGGFEDCCVNGGAAENGDYSVFSTDTYQRLKRDPEFVDLAAMQSGPGSLIVRRDKSDEAAHSLDAEFVSGNYFRTFGLTPDRGRLLQDSDDVEGAPMAAVMSHSLWMREYNGDPSVVGSTFWMNTRPVTIVGIAPEQFYGDRMTSAPPSFYLPVWALPEIGNAKYVKDPNARWLDLIGRVKPGTDQAALQQKLSGQLKQIFAENPIFAIAWVHPMLDRVHLRLAPGGAGLQNMQDDYKANLRLLQWITGMILLIACANIANLLLVRGMGRKAEMSLRTAIGAARSRIIRQLMTESVVLSVIGGAVALAVSYSGAQLLLKLAFPHAKDVPIHASPSLMVMGFALGLSLVTGILFGVVPAVLTSQVQPADALRSSSRSVAGGSSILQRSLVVIQAALSLVLLVGAGMFVQSLGKLEHADLKLDPTNRYIVHFSPQAAGYKPSQLEAVYQQIRDQFHAIPGVMNVGISTYVPMEHNSNNDDVQIEGHPDLHQGGSWVRANEEYFNAVGTHVVMGRGFSVQDTSTAPLVAVVNQAFVKKFFKPGENPVGQHMGDPGPSPNAAEIVGVVEDTVYTDIHWQNHAMYFFPMTQRAAGDKKPLDEMTSFYAGTMVIQTARPMDNIEALTRKNLSTINPNLAVTKFQTFDGQIADQFTHERMLSRLMLMFGGLALLLASIGLYGVTAYGVARRTSEIGIRMALGAERAGVIAMVLRGAVLQVVAGLAIGIPVAWYCVRFVSSQLYDMKTLNLSAMGLAVAILTAASCMAGAIPARRAASIEPASALRSE